MNESDLFLIAESLGVSLSEARDRLHYSRKEYLKGLNEGPLTFYTMEELLPDSDLPPDSDPPPDSDLQVLITPEGMPGTDKLEGPLNYRIYGPSGDIPLYKGNTALAASYVTHILEGGARKPEYLVCADGKDGSQIQIACIGDRSKAMQHAARVLASLPQEEQEFYATHIGGKFGNLTPLYVENVPSHIGELGLV